ncbi:DUF2188 domain-containing protein [Candidatus Bipolaricaulota bacterium]|nr:DUF2188 domain-containing protein [Candidatus Bipolaricaulota bacterium]
MGKKPYHVTPHPDGNWQVKAEGAKRASSKHGTKKEAVKTARERARKQSSQIFIHGKNGRIQEERTYGNDPHPPDG